MARDAGSTHATNPGSSRPMAEVTARETKLIQYSKDACEALEVLGKVCVDVYLRSSTEEISSEKLRPVKL